MTRLKITGNEGLEDGGDTVWIFNFLRDQTVLEHMALRNLGLTGVVKQMEDVKFNLKKLSLRKVTSLLDDDDNIRQFVEKFYETLEELELMNNKLSENFHAMIFESLGKLEVLKADLRGAPKPAVFYKSLRKNNSVKQCILRVKSSGNLNAAKGFLTNLPKIQDLTLEGEKYAPQSLLRFISHKLPMLQKLTINSIKGSMMSSIRIESLKSLYVRKLPALRTDEWKKIVRALPNVEKFSIKKLTSRLSLRAKNISIITKQLTKLRHFQIGSGFVVSHCFFKQLLKNCRNLRIVEILEDAFDSDALTKETILKEFKRTGVQCYIFPLNQIDGVFTEFKDLWTNQSFVESDDEIDFNNTDFESDSSLDSD